mgnify:FL=1
MSTQINVYNDGAEELVQRMRRTRILNMTEKYKKAIDSFSIIIYTANDTAGFAIFDAMNHLKKSPLYRQKVKKTANDANRIYDAYQARLRTTFLDDKAEKLYMDLADNFQDTIKKHVEMVRLSALQLLTKEQHPHRETLSYVVSAYSCLIVAVNVFDGFFMAQQNIIGCNVRKECADFYLKPVRDKWKELVQMVIGGDLEDRMCRDKNFSLACRCLEQQIANNSSLENAARETINRNKRTVIKYLKRKEHEKSICKTSRPSSHPHSRQWQSDSGGSYTRPETLVHQ